MGKSTVAANVALALARMGIRAGLLDTDIFGPSAPVLLGLEGLAGGGSGDGDGGVRVGADDRLLPLTAFGVKVMSMGLLVSSADAAVAWRGLMVGRALEQLLHSVDWTSGSGSSGTTATTSAESSEAPSTAAGLDVLILDLPPGTGDVPLTIAQNAVLSGAVVVTTPHPLALADVRRGISLFRTLGVPLLGVVENMAVFACPCCRETTEVFGRAGGEALRALLKSTKEGEGGKEAELLASVPLDPRIGDDAYRGMPTVAADPDGPGAVVFMDVAKKLARQLGLLRGETG